MASMHAYIDQENFGGLAIDAAMRQLLNGFRLPGTLIAEAIMLSVLRVHTYVVTA